MRSLWPPARKSSGAGDLRHVVVIGDVDPKFDLFDPASFWAGAFLLLFGDVVFVFPVVDDLTDRGIDIGDDLDKGETLRFCEFQRLVGLHDPELFVRSAIDNANPGQRMRSLMRVRSRRWRNGRFFLAMVLVC